MVEINAARMNNGPGIGAVCIWGNYNSRTHDTVGTEAV